MNPLLKNIFVVLAGIVVGSIVNMFIVNMSGLLIPPPEGTDTSTTEGLKQAMSVFEPKHFILPFLAHALGTLIGAFLAVKLSSTHHFVVAMVVGGWFLLGGTIMVFILPSPLWFDLIDLIIAYLPMAYLGWKFANKN